MRAEPIVNGLEEEWGDQVIVVQVDIHARENQTLLSNLDVQFTPTFVLYDLKGQEVWRSVGAIDAKEARRKVATIIDVE
jgi:thiol-disulfide isomerase/thioredoxin